MPETPETFLSSSYCKKILNVESSVNWTPVKPLKPQTPDLKTFSPKHPITCLCIFDWKKNNSTDYL